MEVYSWFDCLSWDFWVFQTYWWSLILVDSACINQFHSTRNLSRRSKELRLLCFVFLLSPLSTSNDATHWGFLSCSSLPYSNVSSWLQIRSLNIFFWLYCYHRYHDFLFYWRNSHSDSQKGDIIDFQVHLMYAKENHILEVQL